MSSQQSQKTSVLSSVARAVKTHHEKANSAFVNFYNVPRLVPSSPTAAQTLLDQQVQANWTLGLKAHQNQIKSQQDSNYSYSTSPSYSSSEESFAKTPATTQTARNTSVSSNDSRRSSKVWESVKKAAKAHHESVNGAYAAYYGIPSPSASRRVSAAPSQ